MFCFRSVMFFMREAIASIQSCDGCEVRRTPAGRDVQVIL